MKLRREQRDERVEQNASLGRRLGQQIDESLEALLRRLQVVEAQVKARQASGERR